MNLHGDIPALFSPVDILPMFCSWLLHRRCYEGGDDGSASNHRPTFLLSHVTCRGYGWESSGRSPLSGRRYQNMLRQCFLRGFWYFNRKSLNTFMVFPIAFLLCSALCPA